MTQMKRAMLNENTSETRYTFNNQRYWGVIPVSQEDFEKSGCLFHVLPKNKYFLQYFGA